MRFTDWVIPFCIVMALLCPARPASAAATATEFSPPLVELTGPWRFSTGDDPHWAAPDFDDSRWETVDLTPAPGAHDGDVGLPGYVAGWGARGHAGYTGFAWYRLELTVQDAPGTALALAGPTIVDSTYELYVDGRRLGGPGVFRDAAVPVVHSVRPSVFPLPRPAATGAHTYLVAMRVWLDPLDASADSGGIRIAPTLGTAAAIDLLHQAQWLRTFKGYVVDAVEPLAFVVLAIMVLALLGCRTGTPYGWMVIALLVLALLRINQVTYAWTPWQSLRGYDIATTVVLRPLALAVWTLAWRDWLGLPRSRWLGIAIGTLAVTHVAVALIGRPWFLPEGNEGISTGAIYATRFLRLANLILYAWVIGLGVLRHPRAGSWLAALAALLVGTGLYAAELNALGIPGIWFPYGTGVARGQYAYAAFVVLMFGLVLARLVAAARPLSGLGGTGPGAGAGASPVHGSGKA